jgi:short-subunit dehydrogenase
MARSLTRRCGEAVVFRFVGCRCASVVRKRGGDVELAGRRALITGGSRGIGEALARAFASKGAHVALVNVSSLAGVSVFPGLAGYSSTKAGLTQFTAGLRADLKGTPVGTTVVELGPVPTEMLDSADEYKPVADSFRRFYRLHLLVDVQKEVVASDVVGAVETGRRHVRHPKRAALFPALAEAPRRIGELLLTGIEPRRT